VRPDAAMGYAACQAALAGEPASGNVGAGMGATVGKLLGMGSAMKAGLGSASVRLPNGLVVGALLVVNALGDVLDPASGQIVAGARGDHPGEYADSLQVLAAFAGAAAGPVSSSANTVIGVVATNARLSKAQANMIAQMAQDGVARSIRPAHTLYDGDTLFALATGELEADPSLVGALAAEATSRAILNAVYSATAAGGLPAAQDWKR
jgi:L-aminopeptidase/D-esterase-like protein